jgi:hypothetical protein
MRVSSPVNPLTSRARRFCDVDDRRHIRVLLKMSRQKFALIWKDKFESIRFLSAPGGESDRVGRERSATVHGNLSPTGALFDFLI